MCHPALTLRAVVDLENCHHDRRHHLHGSHEQLTFTYDDRHWRVRGLDKQLSCERLRVNLMVARRELVHVDTLDLYAARMRRMFIKEAAAELYVEEATIKQDLGRVLLELERRQEALIRQTLCQQEPEVPLMSSAEREDALAVAQGPANCSRGSWPTTTPVAWWGKRPTS